jgi:hypothetical protein
VEWSGVECSSSLGQIIIVDIDDRDGLVRQKTVCSLVKPMDGVVAHNWMALHIQVSHHGIAVPSSHHAYVVDVDADVE